MGKLMHLRLHPGPLGFLACPLRKFWHLTPFSLEYRATRLSTLGLRRGTTLFHFLLLLRLEAIFFMLAAKIAFFAAFPPRFFAAAIFFGVAFPKLPSVPLRFMRAVAF